MLTSIDVAETLKTKIGVDFRPYVILGACNPVLAHQALSFDDNIGLMLPCNVVVAAVEGGTEVSCVRPHAMMDIADSPQIHVTWPTQAQAKLERALEGDRVGSLSAPRKRRQRPECRHRPRHGPQDRPALQVHGHRPARGLGSALTGYERPPSRVVQRRCRAGAPPPTVSSPSRSVSPCPRSTVRRRPGSRPRASHRPM